MSKIFITGDRMLSPVYPALVAVEMLRAVAQGSKIVTGENVGVESIVREYGNLAGIEVEVREGGKAEFDKRHQTLAQDEISVVVVHTDPHASSVFKSVIANVPEDEVRLVTAMDLLV